MPLADGLPARLERDSRVGPAQPPLKSNEGSPAQPRAGAERAREGRAQVVEVLHPLLDPASRVQTAEMPREGVEIFAVEFEAASDEMAQSPRGVAHELPAGERALGDNLRRRAGRGRAHVRHEIADREINLMA